LLRALEVILLLLVADVAMVVLSCFVVIVQHADAVHD